MIEKKFAPDYPKDLLERIIEDGAGDNTYENVYRISNYGGINRDAFLSTFLENHNKNLNTNIRDVYIENKENEDIGIYGTSLTSNFRKAKQLLKLMEKKHDGPILLVGNILPEYGMSMFTKDSKTRKASNKYHIDWWLYESADPSKCFERVNL